MEESPMTKEQIRRCRMFLALKQSEVAERAGISPALVGHVELGRRHGKAKNRVAIEHVLRQEAKQQGVDIEKLFAAA